VTCRKVECANVKRGTGRCSRSTCSGRARQVACRRAAIRHSFLMHSKYLTKRRNVNIHCRTPESTTPGIIPAWSTVHYLLAPSVVIIITYSCQYYAFFIQGKMAATGTGTPSWKRLASWLHRLKYRMHWQTAALWPNQLNFWWSPYNVPPAFTHPIRIPRQLLATPHERAKNKTISKVCKSSIWWGRKNWSYNIKMFSSSSGENRYFECYRI